MKAPLLPLMLLLVMSAQAQSKTFVSDDGSVTVNCEISARSGLITGISSVEIYEAWDKGYVVKKQIGSHALGPLYLVMTVSDTSLGVMLNDELYYLDFSVSTATTEEEQESLMCLYRNVRYPPEAREKSVGGTVIVDIMLNEMGQIIGASTRTNIGFGLEKAAVAALTNCPLEAPKFAGIPVKSIKTVPLSFKLQ